MSSLLFWKTAPLRRVTLYFPAFCGFSFALRPCHPAILSSFCPTEGVSLSSPCPLRSQSPISFFAAAKLFTRKGHQWVFKNASTSARAGMAGAVPIFVTQSAATALANRQASNSSFPSESATARPPLNASPAPVVSTASTWKGSIMHARAGVAA